MISAAQAAEWGLVNEVVPHDGLAEAVTALAERLAALSPVAVAANLSTVARGLNLPIDEALAVEALEFARLVATEDAREGIAAFVEKRPAYWVGR